MENSNQSRFKISIDLPQKVDTRIKDSKKVSTIEEVMLYNQECYEMMLKSNGEGMHR